MNDEDVVAILKPNEVKHIVDISFPNGLKSWQETHYEVCTILGFNDEDHYENSADQRDACSNWTDEFEQINKGRLWDGEWMEEIEQFVENKIKNLNK